MAIWNRTSVSSSGDEPKVARDSEFGKTDYDANAHYEPAEGEVHNASGENQNLHRGLEARHITMIAIGGAIGM